MNIALLSGLFLFFQLHFTKAAVDDGGFRILNGNDIDQKEIPWIVSLFGCGGSLLTERHVLTAAHCERIKYARIGNEFREIKSVKRHPDYKGKIDRYQNDVAIAELSEPVKGVETIRLPAKRKNKYEGRTATVAGWGRFSTGLDAVDVKVHSEDYCRERKGSWWNSTLEICAGVGGVKDACGGDSGGPLYLKENGKFTQIGIVSRGQECADKTDDSPGIYANVAHFKKWIRQNALGSLGSRAP